MSTPDASSLTPPPVGPSLTAQLAEFKAASAARSSPQRQATIEAATAQLRDSGIERTALRPGDTAPQLSLPDARGVSVRLADLWAQGPVVIVFYRGGWCPYCNLGLRAWQQALAQLDGVGARLVAISPQTPDNSLTTAEKNALAFPVLSDSALEAARGFGVVFDMPADLVALYREAGHDLAATNGNGQWALPVPATYVVGTDGRIVYAHVDADYRHRAEPADVLALLRASEAARARPAA